jgi:hypothetical protein
MRPQSAAEKIRKDAARLMEAADERAEIPSAALDPAVRAPRTGALFSFQS